jgi:hypothetical protein
MIAAPIWPISLNRVVDRPDQGDQHRTGDHHPRVHPGGGRLARRSFERDRARQPDHCGQDHPGQDRQPSQLGRWLPGQSAVGRVGHRTDPPGQPARERGQQRRDGGCHQKGVNGIQVTHGAG